MFSFGSSTLVSFGSSTFGVSGFLGSSTFGVSGFLGSSTFGVSGFLGSSTFGVSGFLGSSTLGSSGFFGSSIFGVSTFSLVFLMVRTPPLLVTLTENSSLVALYPFGAVISVTLYSPSSSLSDSAIPSSLDVSSKLLSPLVTLNLAPARPFPVSESTFLILSLPLTSVLTPPPAALYSHTPLDFYA